MAASDQSIQHLNRLAQLGSALGSPVQLTPAPLRQYAGSFLLILVGLGGLGVAWMIHLDQLVGAMIIALAGLLCLVAAGWNFYVRAGDRCTVQLHERGFVLERFGRSHVVPYAELRSFAVEEGEQLDNGVRQGLRRTVIVATEQGRYRFRQIAIDGRPDPLLDLLRTATAAIAGHMDSKVTSGFALVGRGWRLDGFGLHAGRSGPVPTAEISAVDVHDRRLCVWKGIEEHPFLSAPATGPNALVLHEVLLARLGDGTKRPSPDGLGRILFERRASATLIVILGLVAVGAGIGGVVAGVTTVGGALAMACAVLVGFGALVWGTSVTRFRELGVEKRGLFGAKALRYSDIAELSFGVTRQYHNGVYTGTTSALTISGPDCRVSVQSQTRGSDRALENARDFVAGIVAERLAQTIHGGGEVAWGGAFITAEGVRFHRRRLMGMAKGEEVVVPHGSGPLYSIDAGVFHLFVAGEKSSVLDMACSAANFYPGFILWCRLVSEAAAPQAPAS